MKKHNIWKLFKKYILRSRISIQGDGNKIIIVQEDGTEKIVKNPRIKGLTIHIEGNNNTIKLHLPIEFYCASIHIKNNDSSYIEIYSHCQIKYVVFDIQNGKNQSVLIKSHTVFVGSFLHSLIQVQGHGALTIGEYCLFSHGVFILSTDSHAIFDTGKERIVNQQKQPLVIGDHCWFGARSTITKNTQLPNNTIVGTGSVVTKSFTEANTAIAGNPAIVMKRNINWDYPSP